jgi:hypothetical protein
MSSSSSNPAANRSSLLRALSPATLGVSIANALQEPAEKPGDNSAAISARLAALSLATSLEEVIATIPLSYRDALGAFLKDLTSKAEKAASVSASLRKLRAHQAAGTWPPQLSGLKPPQFQVTKSFEGTNPQVIGQMTTAYAEYRSDILEKAITLKQLEQTYCEAFLMPAGYIPKMRHLALDIFRPLADVHKRPVWKDNRAGEPEIDSWKADPALAAQLTRLIDDLPQIGFYAIEIQRQRSSRDLQKLNAKLALKETADVEMGDATTTTRSVRDLVAKEVSDAIKKAENAGVRVPTHLSPLLTNSLLSEKGQKRRHRYSQERQGPGEGQEEGDSRLLLHQDQAASQASRQEAGQEAHRLWQRQRQSEDIVARATIRYAFPSSYPDAILDLPTPLAIRYLLRSVPPALLEASRYRAGVHVVSPAVVDLAVQNTLSVGARFLLYNKPSAHAVSAAFSDFCNRLRWQTYFHKKKALNQQASLASDDDAYDPDYAVPHTASIADRTDAYIELGLSKGQAYVDNYIHTVIPTIVASSRPSNLVDLSNVRQWMDDNGYLVVPTDKNLGLAVITRAWAFENTLKLLDDHRNYREISPAERQERLETLRTKVIQASEFCEVHVQNAQLSRFLRCKIPDSDLEESPVPRFYGIPKIHKTPVKMRPIIPCHSAAQNPAAKFVSKQLKPLLAQRPYVLKGTKDLALKLSKLQIPKHKKAWLVSGDIVAFYPNVPLEDCLKITLDWWLKDVGKDKSAAECALFSRCLRLACRDLFFDYQDKSYLQLLGLAMGVACSPDLANLYGAHFEEDWLDSSPELKTRIAFFGRFIDDVLAVVYAQTQAEAMAIVTSACVYGGVEMEWSASEWNTPFLDMLVYIDPTSNQVEHLPYRKALNHHERIPWVSHHPKDIKRGTFIGEMSRLAVLSSKPEHYLDAIRALGELYIARGYPVDLVHAWIKANCAKRWSHKMEQPIGEEAPAFVLKTKFNPAWDSFNVQELGRLITESWADSIAGLRNQDSLHTLSTPRWDPTRFDLDTHLEENGVDGTTVPVPRNLRTSEPYSATLLTEGNAGSVLSGGGEALIRTGRLRPVGTQFEVERVLDVSKVGFFDKRWLVSRKRTSNVADLISIWNKSVLQATSHDNLLADLDI